MTFPAHDEDGFGPQQTALLTHASQETLARIGAFLALLDVWRERINLIGPGEGRHLWRRHVLDSLQLMRFISSEDQALVDLGSGAGFPGLVIACALCERPGAHITLVEKSPQKAAFLAAAIAGQDLPARVLNLRIEEAPPRRFDLLTARALAPLPRLIGFAHAWLKPSGKALLLKGKDTDAELSEARMAWSFQMDARPSLSSPEGRVLNLSSIVPGRA